MKKRILAIALASMVCLMAGSTFGQELGKHNIQLNAGLLSGHKVDAGVSPSSVTSNVTADGFMGSIFYSYWIKRNMAFQISAGGLSSDVNSSIRISGLSVGTGSVATLFFGVKYQPWKRTGNEKIKPFLFASVGPCIGSATRTRVGLSLRNETYTESTLGSHFGFGADVVLNRLFMVGLNVGYYLLADFDRPIGSVRNYSSPSFAFSFGIMLGKRAG